MNSNLDKHEFAFYTNLTRNIIKKNSCLDDIKFGKFLNFNDTDLVHRMVKVLRLEVNDTFILFDSYYHIRCKIVKIDSAKQISLEILTIDHNKQISPKIIWLLPLLKREAFEESLYALTEMGAQEIQPIITQKAYKNKNFEKNSNKKSINRWEKIVIAAAEQSKQFVLPKLHEVVSFDNFFKSSCENYKQNYKQNFKICFDKDGFKMPVLLENIKKEQPENIIIISGPEGDLAQQEKSKLADLGFNFCSLTRSVLRAQQAVTVGLGVLRTML